jgi:N-acetylmuramoyl-L-alanine amidase/Secretion system C-terminal sorting domain
MNRNLIISCFLLLQTALFAQKSQVFELDLQKTADFQQIVVSQKGLETIWKIPFDAFEYRNIPFTAASVRVEGQNLQDLGDKIQIILSSNTRNGMQEDMILHQDHESDADPNEIFISQLCFFDAAKPGCSIPNVAALPTNRWLLKIYTSDKNIILEKRIHKIKLRLFHPQGDVKKNNTSVQGAAMPFNLQLEKSTNDVKNKDNGLQQRSSVFIPYALPPLPPTNDVRKNDNVSTRRLAPLAPCDLPPAVSRSVWGAGWSLTNGQIYAGTPSFAPVTHLIVHHSATNNTATNWNAVVAAIFDGHVNTNGWSDVGYNYLIAPDGTLYVGRGGGNNVVGAHYCGKNTNTMGVCMMGNYMTVMPSDTALKTLEKLLAWKCIESNINPTGISNHSSGMINNISGHRAGCATDCPGDSTFAKLGWLRQKVRDRVALCQTKTVDFETKIGQLRLSPNPSLDKKLSLNLDLKQIVSFEIIISDIQGRQVWVEKVQPNQLNFAKTLDLNHLENGFYICTIQAGDFYVSEKVILGF